MPAAISCACVLALIGVLAAVVEHKRFAEWIRGLRDELVFAWRDVTREMP